MEKTMNFPNAMIIGGLKCGSTSLWLNMDKHPDIRMAYRKTPAGISWEMKFWKNTKWKNGFDWYCKHFDEGFNGEKCAGYYNNRASMIAMAKHIPDVKLIFSVRHPVDRMQSQYRMNLVSRKPKVSGTLESNIRKYKGPSMYSHRLTKNILPYFKREQLHICIMERLKDNTTEEMNKIFNFLGLSELDYESEDSGIFKRSEDFLEQNRKEKKFRKWSLQKKIEDQQVRQNLMKLFSNDVKRLKEFLNDDIPEWG